MESRPAADLSLLENPDALLGHLARVLSAHCGVESLFRNEECNRNVRTSSVLLLLGQRVLEPGGAPETCIILNKRSGAVKQSGDLCCPGGAVEPRSDPWFARLLSLPGSTLSRWPCWSTLRRGQPLEAEFLSLLLAAGFRESWEEMRLNPFGLRFLGPLPSQCLVLFRRVVHPMVVWVSRQKKFSLSWEVERIVEIPLRALLNPFNYGMHRLYIPPGLEWRFQGKRADFPCFLYTHEGRADLLWGVTFRIVTLLMELAFGFIPPDPARLPLVPTSLREEYVNGRTNNELRRNEVRSSAAAH
ncbi:MAG: CoA pyrophosphatase [Syntrophobacter sp.]